jgi:hypothetical protein
VKEFFRMLWSVGCDRPGLISCVSVVLSITPCRVTHAVIKIDSGLTSERLIARPRYLKECKC